MAAIRTILASRLPIPKTPISVLNTRLFRLHRGLSSPYSTTLTGSTTPSATSSWFFGLRGTRRMSPIMHGMVITNRAMLT
jgi:hypothetical protein